MGGKQNIPFFLNLFQKPITIIPNDNPETIPIFIVPEDVQTDTLYPILLYLDIRTNVNGLSFNIEKIVPSIEMLT